ncbi:hypothetical protein ACHAWF_002711, partial [Thalassiosira exigua]
SDETVDLRYEPNTGFDVVLGDTDNDFNRINRYLMLWTAFFRWRRGSRFAFNCYWHRDIVIVQDEAGLPRIILYSEEDVVQGCCFRMFLYRIAMVPLCEGARERVVEALQT